MYTYKEKEHDFVVAVIVFLISIILLVIGFDLVLRGIDMLNVLINPIREVIAVLNKIN